MAAQTTAGKLWVIEITDDGGTTWKKVGGMQSKNFNFTNPETDVTNSSTTSEYQEHVFNGFSSASFSGSGVSDSRVSATLVPYQELFDKATSGDRTAELRFTDGAVPTITIAGIFLITDFNITAEEQGQIAFDWSAQSSQDVTVTTVVPT